MKINFKYLWLILFFIGIQVTTNIKSCDLNEKEQSKDICNFQAAFSQLEKTYDEMAKQEIEKIEIKELAISLVDFLIKVEKLEEAIKKLPEESKEKYKAIFAYLETAKTGYAYDFAIYKNKETLIAVRNFINSSIQEESELSKPLLNIISGYLLI